MCDNLNTTYVTEAECRFCETREDCAVFRSSFIHRCKYFTIPKRYDQWGYADGFCTDDIDFVSGSLAPWGMIIGWALLMFGIGLLRKERGDYAALRRYGVQVNADVVERTTTESLVKTEPSMPDVKITRYYARASWPIDPAKWGVGNKYCRWAAIRRHVSRYCRRRRGQPAKVSGAACSSLSSASLQAQRSTILPVPSTTVCCVSQEHPWEKYRVHQSSLRGGGWSAPKVRGKRLWSIARASTGLAAGSSDSDEEAAFVASRENDSSAGDKLTRTVSFADADASGGGGGGAGSGSGGGSGSSPADHILRVEKTIQVSSSEWEQVIKKHMVIRICYDPMIGGSVMPLSAIVGQATPRLLLLTVSAFVGLSIIMMGMVSCSYPS